MYKIKNEFMKIYDFKVLDAKVVEVPMTGYQGKVLLGDEQEILVFCC